MILLKLWFVAGLLWAQGTEPKGGDGGGVPVPHWLGNQKFELADGEIYNLVGWIHIEEGYPFFQVDFSMQPWLANRLRYELPFYLIDSSFDLTSLQKRRVRVTAMARQKFTRPPKEAGLPMPIQLHVVVLPTLYELGDQLTGRGEIVKPAKHVPRILLP